MSKNAIPAREDVAARIAAQSLSKRSTDYATEVRRLLDAALQVMAAHGTTSRTRVADIVAAAGLSNEAFYRHFPSKDALVSALLEDGTERLASYVAHQMGKESTPEGKIRRWVEGILSQTNEKTAATTLAILWYGTGAGAAVAAERYNPSIPLGALVHEPFAALGSSDPEMDAGLVAHALIGKVADYLWARKRPSRDELDLIVGFCTRVATAESKKH